MQSPMSGLTNLYIMTSKILIGLTENSQPCIKINLGVKNDDDLRDQVAHLFFEQLEHESSFVGVVTRDVNSYRELIPLSIPNTCEWLQKFFIENKVFSRGNIADRNSEREKAEKILLAFKYLREVYYDQPDMNDPGVLEETIEMILSGKR